MKYTNIYYFNTIQKIGGIETFFYELAKKYNDYDITIVYKQADKKQLARLKPYIRCIKYTGQKIQCERAFFNFNTDIIDNVEAKEYCLVVHGDYKMLAGKPPTHKKINKYYGVSQVACDSFTELTGLPCELVYNPLNIEKPKKLLTLVTACRLDDPVKGGTRTKELINELDNYCRDNDCNYLFLIFTNPNSQIISNKNVCYMEPRLDVLPYMAKADYVIQLSDDFEGFNYTVNESLVNNVPVVITPCKVYKELGIDDSMSIRLNFDLSNLKDVVKEMFNKCNKFNFNYTPPADNWGEIFIKSKSTYKEELKMNYKVRALDTYKKYDVSDQDLANEHKVPRYVPTEGEEWIISKERLDVLLGDNDNSIVYVEVVEEIKPNEEVEKPKRTRKATTKK